LDELVQPHDVHTIENFSTLLITTMFLNILLILLYFFASAELSISPVAQCAWALAPLGQSGLFLLFFFQHFFITFFGATFLQFGLPL
jgi:hypothetical protein